MEVKQKRGTVLEFLFLQGRLANEIAERLQSVYGRDVHCLASVF
jgi:hypothetical protein